MNFIFNWLHDRRLEKKSTGGSEVASKSSGSSDEWSEKTNRCMDAPGTEIQIPDPWDDPLM